MSMTDTPEVTALPSATAMIEDALRQIPDSKLVDHGVVVDILLDLRQELQKVMPS